MLEYILQLNDLENEKISKQKKCQKSSKPYDKFTVG